MATPDTKNVLTHLIRDSGDSWCFYGGHSTIRAEQTQLFTDNEHEQSYISIKCAAGDKDAFTSDDYLLYVVPSYRGDPTEVQPTPVLGLGPDEADAQSLPFNASPIESVLAAHVLYDDTTGRFHLWYWVYGWTSSDDDNTDPQDTLASLQYDDSKAADFDAGNWWVVPQRDGNFPLYAKAALILMFTRGSVQILDSDDSSATSGSPYLVFDQPVLAQQGPTMGDTQGTAFVLPTSGTKTGLYYPGVIVEVDPATGAITSGDKCWILDLNG